MVKYITELSEDSLPNNFHGVLEGLYCVGQVVKDFILIVETLIHLKFKLLAKASEFIHCLPLEFLDIFVLPLQLIFDVISEGTKLETLIGPFIINLLVKLVLLIVKFLEDVLLSVNASLYLLVKGSLLVIEVCAHSKNGFITFNNAVFDFLMNAILNAIHAFLSDPELVAVVLSHKSDLLLELLLELAELEFELRCEGFQGVLDTLDLSICEVFIGLYFPIDVLELGLQLFLRLNAFTQHDIIIMIHLGQLMLHLLDLLVVILVFSEVPHVFLNKLSPGGALNLQR